MPNQEGAEPKTSKPTDVQHRHRSLNGANKYDAH